MFKKTDSYTDLGVNYKSVLLNNIAIDYMERGLVLTLISPDDRLVYTRSRGYITDDIATDTPKIIDDYLKEYIQDLLSDLSSARKKELIKGLENVN